MPVLALPDLNNPLGMYLAQLAVRAVMAWPTDKAARRQYVTAALAHHLGELEAAKDELPDFAEAADWFEAIAAWRAPMPGMPPPPTTGTPIPGR